MESTRPSTLNLGRREPRANERPRKTRIRLEPVAEALDSTSDRPGPPEHAESGGRRVHRAVEQLPEHQRTLIELAYWRGLSQSEIASHLDVPLGTVRTRTRAVLGRLAQLLEEEQLQ